MLFTVTIRNAFLLFFKNLFSIFPMKCPMLLSDGLLQYNFFTIRGVKYLSRILLHPQ